MKKNEKDLKFGSPEHLKRLRLARLGEEIRGFRVNKEIGVRELAKKLDINPSYVSKLEKGDVLNPLPEMLQKIASILDENYLYFYYLIGYIDEKTYKVFQKEKDGNCITKVKIYKELKYDSRTLGKIHYITEVAKHKELKGYVIEDAKLFDGKPKYTYAIVHIDGNLNENVLSLWKDIEKGTLMFRKLITLKNCQMLIDPTDSFNNVVITSKKYEFIGPIIDFIVDLNGKKLSDGSMVPMLASSGDYTNKRRESLS